MLTKQEYLSKPKYASLSRQDKERRWRQYLASKALATQPDIFAPMEEPDPLAAVAHTFPSCAVHYLQALENPFHLNAEACIPDLHAVPSKKVKAITRLTFGTNTTGEAFFVACPQDKSKDTDAFLFNTTAFVGAGGNTLVPIPGSPNISGASRLKLPYLTAQFANVATGGIRGRVVGTAQRLRYTGREIDRGGQVVAFRHPTTQMLLVRTPSSN
jgi:hypothetical protein